VGTRREKFMSERSTEERVEELFMRVAALESRLAGLGKLTEPEPAPTGAAIEAFDAIVAWKRKAFDSNREAWNEQKRREAAEKERDAAQLAAVAYARDRERAEKERDAALAKLAEAVAFIAELSLPGSHVSSGLRARAFAIVAAGEDKVKT
jgi:hypothetical protein